MCQAGFGMATDTIQGFWREDSQCKPIAFKPDTERRLQAVNEEVRMEGACLYFLNFIADGGAGDDPGGSAPDGRTHDSSRAG